MRPRSRNERKSASYAGKSDKLKMSWNLKSSSSSSTPLRSGHLKTRSVPLTVELSETPSTHCRPVFGSTPVLEDGYRKL